MLDWVLDTPQNNMLLILQKNHSKEVNLTPTLWYHLEILQQQHLSLFHHANLKE